MVEIQYSIHFQRRLSDQLKQKKKLKKDEINFGNP